jgi:DMSO/TMAO reductase YedYZ heme-binding membrane subunit
MTLLPPPPVRQHFWREWSVTWARINRYWSTWLSYLLVALGGLMTYWDSLDDYLPKKLRGITYAVIGILVLLLRARRDFDTLRQTLKTPPP